MLSSSNLSLFVTLTVVNEDGDFGEDCVTQERSFTEDLLGDLLLVVETLCRRDSYAS